MINSIVDIKNKGFYW